MRFVYFLLFIVGTAAPLSLFGPWLLAHEFNLSLFVAEALVNPVAAAFVVDVLICGAVIVVMAGKLPRGELLCVLGALGLAGASSALPLALFFMAGRRPG
ncbi:MAG: DUF2834 domain-containing protein [Parvibaculales bacterium]